MNLSSSELNTLYNIASKLQISNPQWFMDMIRFESGFDPQAKNPGSTARGLIQFMDSTAITMGYKNSFDLVNQHPTIESQLKGPVYDYLKPYRPFTSEHQLYMAVFFPYARKYNSDTPFTEIFKDLYGSKWQNKYAEFIELNPGITSPRAYMNKVKRIKIIKKTAWGIGSLALIAAIWYLFIKK